MDHSPGPAEICLSDRWVCPPKPSCSKHCAGGPADSLKPALVRPYISLTSALQEDPIPPDPVPPPSSSSSSETGEPPDQVAAGIALHPVELCASAACDLQRGASTCTSDDVKDDKGSAELLAGCPTSCNSLRVYLTATSWPVCVRDESLWVAPQPAAAGTQTSCQWM